MNDSMTEIERHAMKLVQEFSLRNAELAGKLAEAEKKLVEKNENDKKAYIDEYDDLMQRYATQKTTIEYLSKKADLYEREVLLQRERFDFLRNEAIGIRDNLLNVVNHNCDVLENLNNMIDDKEHTIQMMTEMLYEAAEEIVRLNYVNAPAPTILFIPTNDADEVSEIFKRMQREKQ